MDNSEWSFVLKSHDDPANSSAPDEFDLGEALERFRCFLDELNTAMESEFRFECGGQVEDAAFHSQIFISDNDDDICFIRFSNFGSFVSLYSDQEIEQSLSNLLQSLFIKHNYKYLPFAEVALQQFKELVDQFATGFAGLASLMVETAGKRVLSQQ